MPAYVIAEVEILDDALDERYRDLAAASIASHGGRYVVRGTEPEVAEGKWPAAGRMVVVEFPTMGQLHQWYASVEYAAAVAGRHTELHRRLLFMDGVKDPDRSSAERGG